MVLAILELKAPVWALCFLAPVLGLLDPGPDIAPSTPLFPPGPDAHPALKEMRVWWLHNGGYPGLL